MPKKTIIVIFCFLLASPALIPAFSIFYAAETRVCGMDQKNYPSLSFAEKSGIEVSYDFPCEFPISESGLYERKAAIGLVGMLLDSNLDSKGIYLYLRNNSDKINYFVSGKTGSLDIESLVPGDQILVEGEINGNTKEIEAKRIIDITQEGFLTRNCRINGIDISGRSVICGQETMRIGDRSRILAGFKNASLENLMVGDTARVRLDREGVANLLLVTGRDGERYLRNRIFKAELVFDGIEKSDSGITLKAVLEKKPSFALLEPVYAKGDKLVLRLTKESRLVRKYFGKMKPEEIGKGDKLLVVGKANDDGSFEAFALKDNSVWK